jgi:hypothetical protein
MDVIVTKRGVRGVGLVCLQRIVRRPGYARVHAAAVVVSVQDRRDFASGKVFVPDSRIVPFRNFRASESGTVSAVEVTLCREVALQFFDTSSDAHLSFLRSVD